LDALFRAHLPMVFHLVRQTLGDSPDVDDVVQDVVVYALREQPELREPGCIRRWLEGITACQIATHLARAKVAAECTAPLDAAAWMPDADIEGPALLRVELAEQRRQVGNASRWLAAEDRAPLSLWLMEVAGELSRTDVAATLGLSVAHTGVRLQRMREQLCLCRTIVAALEAMPGCDELSAAIADWNGVPSPFWRKRLARHTRSCPVCLRAAESLIPVERLLAGVARKET
jgi:RNA polymerase sigma factor (sigma-70 family)